MSLFDTAPMEATSARRPAPLAERMRPRSLDEFFGQAHLLGTGMPLRLQIENEKTGTGPAPSLIF